MDENETVARDKEQLDDLEEDIERGRAHLKEMTHEGEPEFYDAEDTSPEPRRDEQAEEDGKAEVQPPG